MAHLDRQTMGDPALRAEVLRLYVAQMAEFGSILDSAPLSDRPILIHTIKGASRGIGAFLVADAAEQVERLPAEPARIEALKQQIDEALRQARTVVDASTR